MDLLMGNIILKKYHKVLGVVAYVSTQHLEAGGSWATQWYFVLKKKKKKEMRNKMVKQESPKLHHTWPHNLNFKNVG